MDQWESVHSSHQLPGQTTHQEKYEDNENFDCGGLGWRTVAYVFGHWSDHWGELVDGCYVTRHSRSGTA